MPILRNSRHEKFALIVAKGSDGSNRTSRRCSRRPGAGYSGTVFWQAETQCASDPLSVWSDVKGQEAQADGDTVHRVFTFWRALASSLQKRLEVESKWWREISWNPAVIMEPRFSTNSNDLTYAQVCCEQMLRVELLVFVSRWILGTWSLGDSNP
jgi:hypothetical protein